MTGESRRIPDFFIVGQAKSGTTALYEMLRRHPDVYMPALKEPEFLASDMRPRFQPPMTDPLPASMDEYLALFADAQPGQLAGEASAFYLSSRAAAAEIAALNPAARIIAIFREPASFLHSVHLQLIESHNEDQRDLRRALALEAARSEGRDLPARAHHPQFLAYSQHVRYTEQLERYEALFPREQILVLIYDDFRADNAGTVRRILRFLGLDDTAPVTPLRANPSVGVRSQTLDDAVHRFSVGRGPYSRAVKASVKTLVPARVRRGLLRTVQRRVVHAEPPAPDEQLAVELRAWLHPEVERLGAHIGRDLVSLWGYDRA